MTEQQQLIYTTIFKAYHLNIESDCIQLSQSAWIERSNDFINQPNNFHPSLLAFSGKSEYGLSGYYQQLIESPIRLRTIHTEEEEEGNPFQIHDCSHIAIAATILCEPWFVVGIESFLNNRTPGNASLGPYTTFFVGDNSVEPAQISKSEEDRLIHIYKFVHRSLALSSWESDNAKLLLLFLRCVARTPYQRFTVLKLGLDHLFTEWHATILNAALFFEYLFTNESKNYGGGIQIWNRIYSPTAYVDEGLVDIVFYYRHLVAHSNPTYAKRQISDWKAHSGFDDQTACQMIRRTIWSTAKTCLRAIIDDEAKYCAFQSARPK